VPQTASAATALWSSNPGACWKCQQTKQLLVVIPLRWTAPETPHPTAELTQENLPQSANGSATAFAADADSDLPTEPAALDVRIWPEPPAALVDIRTAESQSWPG